MDLSKLYIPTEDVENFNVLYQIVEHATKKYPDKTAYCQPEGRNGDSEISFSELRSNIDALRASLFSRGFKNKHIAILGESSYQWMTVYLAVVSGVGVAVPMDKENPVQTVGKQLDHSDVECVFCSARCVKKLQSVLPFCPKIKTVVLMRTDLEVDMGEVETLYFDALIGEGKALIKENGSAALPETNDPDLLRVIIYTSGTTGANKGVMLSNRNIMGTLRGCARLLHYPKTSISVLPINHSYELHAHLMSSMYCGTTVFMNDDLKHMLKNIERFAPEMSCMVPMMLDLIVRKIKKQIADGGKEKKFAATAKISNALLKVGVDLRRRLFAPVLAVLGGNLRMIICGGAALSQETADFLRTVGITVYNGYGITECSPVAAVNPLAKVRRFSVGHLLPTMTARIADPDENGNGEIQLFGENVMLGYYKAPLDTKQVFTEDGWFRTGDIGHIDKFNYLYINGRLKNLIILPNGKNVCPEEIEVALKKKIPYIKECVVVADESNTGIYALVYPDPEQMRDLQLETPGEIKAYMENDVQAFNRDMPGFKRIADFEIVSQEFAKNTTHKIQRFKIAAVRKKEEPVNV
ncbi:MAG: AMP-binding protein [Clostridia bacterium]|nr:AMP-binding protein [Clostridia bacterium]